MKNSFAVRQITAAESAELRRAVLRPGLPTGSALPGDDDPTAVHLGAFDGRALLSACLIFPEDCPWLPGEPAWRLRGMASDPLHRGAGAGTAVLREAVRWASADSATVLWCLARATAVDFYRRNGWAAFHTLFDTDLGPHLKMWLGLAPLRGQAP